MPGSKADMRMASLFGLSNPALEPPVKLINSFFLSPLTLLHCIGCRYGIGDSVGLAVQLENRYRGVRSPHKFKGGVSGCVRECAEAQGKDFGVIATDKGWNSEL
jgi:NAD(P)H-nitrite reductase large subunit